MKEGDIVRVLLILALTSFVILHLVNVYVFTNVTLPLVQKTGAVTDTGTITLTGAGAAGIVLNNITIAFGSGYYNGSCLLGYAILDSNNVSNPSENCWVNTSAYLTQESYHGLENTGTVTVNITAYGDKQDAEQLFCQTAQGCTSSTTSQVALKTISKESGACGEGETTNYTALLEFDLNKTISLCSQLDFTDDSDELYIPIRLQVPIDAKTGVKTLDITYEAIAA